MSTLTSSLLPTAAVQNTTVSNPNGFQSLTPSDFVQMMVTQLQNQDPLNPTNSQDILTQISEIGQLQSSTSLQSSLTGMTLQNQIGAASAMIGKNITGTDASNNNQTGTVTGVTITQVPAAQSPTGVATTNVNLNLNTGAVVPLSNVSSIQPAPATLTSAAAATAQAAAAGATLNTPATPTTQPSTSNS